jgi:hypothetical protein
MTHFLSLIIESIHENNCQLCNGGIIIPFLKKPKTVLELSNENAATVSILNL